MTAKELISKQGSGVFFDGDTHELFQELVKAHPGAAAAMIDAFLLGYIKGKQADRARRKHTTT